MSRKNKFYFCHVIEHIDNRANVVWPFQEFDDTKIIA